MWRRVAPAVCALVLAAGGIWTGTLENQSIPAASEHAMVTSYRSASNGMNAKYSMMAAEESYDMAAGYDMGVTTYGAAQQTERKLVRSADITIRTSDYDQALEQVQN